jgi:hypothetical protein
MTKLVIILTLLIILLLFHLFMIKNEEGFMVDLKPTTIKSYNDFLLFYNTFCANWQKSIKSAVASQIPQQPLTSPSQVNSSTAPDIPEGDMNNYIVKLSQQLLRPLPPICKALPSLDANSLTQIIKEIPKSTKPFINALNWMNTQLEESQANLGSALQGIPPTFETFEDMCDNISACFDNNPELIKRVALDLAEQQKREQEQQEEQLVKAVQPFLIEQDLRQAFDKNITLFNQAQKIQNKAESGQLLNEMKLPDNDSIIKYTRPPGANNLINMKQNNPARYNEIQKNNKQWFSIKGLTDQINSSL